MAPLVRAEQGCLRHGLHPVVGQGNGFFLIERWVSNEALAAHDATRHMIVADADSPSLRTIPRRFYDLPPTASHSRSSSTARDQGRPG
ncbi:antibiotic biosynthesis monooxygenase [Burkholderia sp. D-99]|uniref:putative quinol monooxygenase n=1 Tax=Burkholderia sp. D-99 TaxID=2717316 RepID=UPI001AA161E8